MSPARARLQDLLDKKTSCEERAKQLRIAQQRLVGRDQEAASAAAALSEFDRQNADAMAAWARGESKDGDMPEIDIAKRQDLVAANALAAENAAAAQSASAQLAAEAHADDLVANDLKIPIEIAIAEVISESVEPLIEGLHESVRVAVAKQNMLKQSLQVVIGIAHSGDSEIMRPIFGLAGKLSERLRTAAAPVVETAAADRAAWDSLVARLRTDATAELET
ncbi:hypothetical protein GGQ85_001673 [Nitrobacter vulgaris]|uniref:hypothetical protein n=1 Tax=Nitrobacter vulgaris TaxID=29421 RepID=UPI0028611BCF|nr:hypothetical protein [Nitrobacter vulgaris]MDR6303974.1 hypothetical protein [Nitrobacter vulgaris]